MAKSKTKLRHIHKVRVHENRWLMWAVAAAIIVTAALIGFIQVSSENFDRDMQGGDYVIANWSNFTNSSSGYSLKYPKSWGTESDGNDGFTFTHPQDVNSFFSVSEYPLSAEREIKATFFKTKEETVKVDGVSAVKISQNKNQSENVVMVKSNSKLFVLHGRGDAFSRIVESFKFTK